jgi:hypothetical protein
MEHLSPDPGFEKASSRFANGGRLSEIATAVLPIFPGLILVGAETTGS